MKTSAAPQSHADAWDATPDDGDPFHPVLAWHRGWLLRLTLLGLLAPAVLSGLWLLHLYTVPSPVIRAPWVTLLGGCVAGAVLLVVGSIRVFNGHRFGWPGTPIACVMCVAALSVAIDQGRAIGRDAAGYGWWASWKGTSQAELYRGETTSVDAFHIRYFLEGAPMPTAPATFRSTFEPNFTAHFDGASWRVTYERVPDITGPKSALAHVMIDRPRTTVAVSVLVTIGALLLARQRHESPASGHR
jgi:hypothetical protein